MVKRTIILIYIVLICISSVFCLNSTSIPNGSYLSVEDNGVLYLYFDKETEGFVLYYEILGESKDDVFYLSLYGDYSSYSDDNELTLFSYSEDGEYIGTIPINFYSYFKGMKITIGGLGIIGIEMDKISNEYMSVDEVKDFISNNSLKYPRPKTTPNTTSVKNKELGGTYLLFNKEKISYLFFDKETNGFIFYDENIQKGGYRVFFGTISKSLLDEKKYTLYSYDEDFNFIGGLQMTSVFRDKGIKITINQLKVVGWEMEKISNQKMRLDDISDYISKNKEKYIDVITYIENNKDKYNL